MKSSARSSDSTNSDPSTTSLLLKIKVKFFMIFFLFKHRNWWRLNTITNTKNPHFFQEHDSIKHIKLCYTFPFSQVYVTEQHSVSINYNTIAGWNTFKCILNCKNPKLRKNITPLKLRMRGVILPFSTMP
jgi:hypothetical protein